MGCPHCGYNHPADGVCLSPIVREAFGVPFDDLDKIKEAVMEAIKLYGNDDGPTHQRILTNGLWNDHIAVQAGIAVWKMLQAERRSPSTLTEPAGEAEPGEHQEILDAIEACNTGEEQ